MPDTSKRLEKAEKLLQKGKSEAALEEYLIALDEDPKNDQVRQTAAELCLTCGRKAEAASLFTYLLNEQVNSGDFRGVVTYKKLAKIAAPTPFQMLQYAQLVSKRDKREALEAYAGAMQGFEKLNQDKQAFSAAQEMVELAPTPENLQRLGEKAAELGHSKIASESFVQLGLLKEQTTAGSGFEWFDKAYYYDAFNLQAILLYSRGLFVHKSIAQCVAVLDHAVNHFETTPEMRDLYARALMAAGRPADAEPYAWELFEKNPQRVQEIVSLIGAFLDVDDNQGALTLAMKLEQHQTKAGNRREFISMMQEMSANRRPSVEFLEYLVQLFNSANREQDYCRTLIKVFQLYYAEGRYAKAGEALDRAAEVDPYEPGHSTRLEMLRGKIDGLQFNTIANRFQTSSSVVAAPVQTSTLNDPEPAALDDFILQAEIYQQYGMRPKALELLERVKKLFPGEEDSNEKLRHLYISAGMLSASSPPLSKPPAPSADLGKAPANLPASASPKETPVNSFARVAEITRSIYRQSNVKSVLSTAVNEIGRYFNASRCVAGLCTLGKPPSAALEYCAPGVKQSDVIAIVKLIAVSQQVAVQGVVSLPANAAELDSAREHIQALSIKSMLVAPLIDSGEQAGIVILEQCEPREWQQNEVEVLKTIAEQMVLAVSNARLRSLMKTLAVTDEKSGLLKRSSYLDVLLSEVRRSLQQRSPLTVMLLHFGKASVLVKEIGEPAVETMMQEIGQTLSSHIRQNDVALRYDITSIALLLADTNEKTAFLVVDKMRKVFGLSKIPGTGRTPSISAGIAEVVLREQFDPVDIVTEVINRVENALEAARAEGGNKTRALPANLQTVA